jgi:hypothetical protein
MTTETVSEMSRPGWGGRGSLKELVAELERQKDSRHDVVIDTRQLQIGRHGDTNAPMLMPRAGCDRNTFEWFDVDGIPISDSAFGQVCGRVGVEVPVRFGRKLWSEEPGICSGLLSDLMLERPKRWLVRILDGRVRAVLSDSYQPFDHFDIAFKAMEVAREHDAEVIECSLTEQAMNLKLVRRDLWDKVDEVRVGEKSGWYAGGLGNQEHLGKVYARTRGDMPGGPGTVHPIVTIRNSETGHGALSSRAGLLRAVCFNLATVETVIQQVHLGQKLDPGVYGVETRKLETQAAMAKTRDGIAGAMTPEVFKRMVAKAQAAQDTPVDATAAVDFAVSEAVISQESRDALLAHFLGGDVDHTAYGFAQSVARYAQDVENGDSATDLEAFAGRIIESPSLVSI